MDPPKWVHPLWLVIIFRNVTDKSGIRVTRTISLISTIACVPQTKYQIESTTNKTKTVKTVAVKWKFYKKLSQSVVKHTHTEPAQPK